MNPNAVVHLLGPGFDIPVPMGDGPWVVTAGGAVYEEVTRPERTAITDYTGNQLIRMDGPAFYDGWRDQRDVWPEVQQILGLCLGHDGNDPVDFVASGPIPHSGRRFVMEQPEWGAGNRSAGGALIRQELTLHLVQFVDPAVIRFRRRKKHKPKVVTAKEGQTLIQIAAKYLHDASKAGAIGKLNGIRDVRKKLNAGRKIKLPAG